MIHEKLHLPGTNQGNTVFCSLFLNKVGKSDYIIFISLLNLSIVSKDQESQSISTPKRKNVI